MPQRWLPWVVTMGIVVSLAAWQGARAYDSWLKRSMLKSAKDAVAARSVSKARGLLASAQSRWPGDGEVDFLLGACEQALRHLDAAVTAWSRVKDDSPFAPAASLFSARIALSHDRLAVAEPLLIKALRGKGKYETEARETLVHIYKLEGRFDEARIAVLEATAAYPDTAGVLREMENLGSNNPIGLERIRSTLEKAARNAPDDDRIWLGWANLAIRSGRLDEARRRLDDCLRRRPEDPAVWKARLDWALAGEDPAEVMRAVRHLPPRWLSPSEVLNLRAWLAWRSGDIAREKRAEEDLVAREPGSLRALARLADLATSEGRPEEAARIRERRAELNRIKYAYQTAVNKLDPSNAPEAARMAETLGRYVEAQTIWSLVARSDPGNREAQGSIQRLHALQANRPLGPTLRDLVAEFDMAPSSPRVERAPFRAKLPAFVDEAEAAGLQFRFDNGASSLRQMPETMSGGVGLLDFDGDGWLDVYLTQAGPFPPDLTAPDTEGDRLYHNRGDGTFEDATASSGLAAFARGYSHGVAVGDYDNDGRPDVFVTRWRGYALYRNCGDGTFEDVTRQAGLEGDRNWPTSAAFGDFDGDGDLDLYVCHYVVWNESKPIPCWNKDERAYCSPQYSPSRPDHLFRNDAGRFVDVSAEAGIVDNAGRGLGVVAADLDGDGALDLFVANDQSANFLFRNRGGLHFEEVAHTSGVASNSDGIYQASMGIACGDLDGDGLPDLAKTNFYNESTTLYKNLGRGVYSDVTAAIGLAAPSRYLLGFGVAFLDANNDGWLDLATANGHVDDPGKGVPREMPAQLLIGTGGGNLIDVSGRAGPPWRVPRIARGLAAGDLDNDGRTDLLILSQNAPLAYFHNRSEGGHWLTLRLEGTVSNRDAVGARVAIAAGGLRRTDWRVGGGSYQSASDPRLRFGLGSADRVDQIEVTWPSGRVDRFGPLAVDTGYLLREGDRAPKRLAGYSTEPQSAAPLSFAAELGPSPGTPVSLSPCSSE
jgi:enediyne biosynthesis protein E4